MGVSVVGGGSQGGGGGTGGHRTGKEKAGGRVEGVMNWTETEEREVG